MVDFSGPPCSQLEPPCNQGQESLFAPRPGACRASHRYREAGTHAGGVGGAGVIGAGDGDGNGAGDGAGDGAEDDYCDIDGDTPSA